MNFDREIQDLHARIVLHLTYEPKHLSNHVDNFKEFAREYKRVSEFPVAEVNSDVWNKLDAVAMEHGIKDLSEILTEYD